jgi:class 3 adenylate cyclase
MTLKDDIAGLINTVIGESWDIRDGRTIPDVESVALRGGAVRIKACILFTDLVASSQLTENFQKRTAAKIYKAFLAVATRIATNNGGTITAFDGDRMMAAFVGDKMCEKATKTAMQLTWAMNELVRPALRRHFESLQAVGFDISHCSGLDVGELFVVKAGNRSANDLVWVGKATNLAARLSEVRIDEKTLISIAVYNELPDWLKKKGDAHIWTQYAIEFAGQRQECGKTTYYIDID